MRNIVAGNVHGLNHSGWKAPQFGINIYIHGLIALYLAVVFIGNSFEFIVNHSYFSVTLLASYHCHSANKTTVNKPWTNSSNNTQLSTNCVQISMMTSSNGNIFRVTSSLWGESTGHRWIPKQRPVTRSFHIFFDLCLYIWLSKQSRRRWFQTPSRSL